METPEMLSLGILPPNPYQPHIGHLQENYFIVIKNRAKQRKTILKLPLSTTIFRPHEVHSLPTLPSSHHAQPPSTIFTLETKSHVIYQVLLPTPGTEV